MTEREQKAIKWIKNIRDDAVVTLDHIAKNEPNVSPILYAGRKEKAETIIQAFDELEQYRKIGTVQDCASAQEKKNQKKTHTKVQKEDVKIGNVTFKAGTKVHYCPECNMAVTGSDRYCRTCGQALLW